MVSLPAFERYEMEAVLGHGGFATVYKVRDRLLGRSVALKTLHATYAADADMRTRFLDEARRAARLRHRNIVTIYDVGEEHGAPYFTMEVLDGVTLFDWVAARGPLPLGDAVDIMGALCDAVDHVHAHQLVHRDIKAANVIREPSGRVVLMDFGIARALDRTSYTPAGATIGSPEAMAPEQAQGLDAGAPADIYALGVLTYRLLAGRPPFTGGTIRVMYAHVHEPPPPLQELRAGLPAPVYAAIHAALEKDPVRRPPSAGAFARMLKEEPTALTGSRPTGRADFYRPPRRTALAPRLPSPLTSFVGREREIDEIRADLADPRVRLVTLLGPGGSGKTRLALRVAEGLSAAFPGGVFFVDLSTATEPEQVGQAILKAAKQQGMSGTALAPLAPEPIDEQVKRHLQHQHALLLLDNFEQALTAVPLIADLLVNCPELKALVTSRTSLRIHGERLYPVDPLAVPAAEQPISQTTALTYPAVQLFLQRARDIRKDLALDPAVLGAVVEICRKLDGMPLALELAAARLRALSPQALLERLDERLELLTIGSRDAPTRHQTLRAAIDGSYTQLSGPERAVFRRLSVFVGGMSLEAAAAVCAGGEVGQIDVLDLLIELADKSMVRLETSRDEERFRLLETIREYAAERLRESGDETSAHARHRAWYLELAERAQQELRGPEQSRWLIRLEQEHPNLRAAFDECLADPAAAEMGLRIAVSLSRFWEVRGYLSEGRRRLDQALGAGSGEPPGLRARALHAAGLLAQHQGEIPTAHALYEQAMVLRRAEGDELGIAIELNNLGILARDEGDFPRAVELHEQALALRRQHNDALGIAMSLTNLGILARDQADFGRAGSLYQDALQLYERLGDMQGVAIALVNLGEVTNLQGEHARAIGFIERGLLLYHELGDRQRLAYAIEDLAAVMTAEGQFVQAAQLCGAASALRDAIGAPLATIDRADYERLLAALRTQLDDAAFTSALDDGRNLSIDELVTGATVRNSEP